MAFGIAVLIGVAYLISEVLGTLVVLAIPAALVMRHRGKRRAKARLMVEAEQHRIELRARMATLGGMLVMTPTEFEEAIGDLLIRWGFTAVERVGGSGDLAVDLRCRDPAGRFTVVQCKRYGPGHNIGSGDIQKFVGMIHVHGADRGIFITTSGFTEPARELAKRAGVGLIDGPELAKRAGL